MAAASNGDAEDMLTLEPDALEYIINNVIMPPKLPQDETYNPTNEMSLLKTIITQLHAFGELVGEPYKMAVESAKKSMNNLQLTHVISSGCTQIDERGLNGVLGTIFPPG